MNINAPLIIFVNRYGEMDGHGQPYFYGHLTLDHARKCASGSSLKASNVAPVFNVGDSYIQLTPEIKRILTDNGVNCN